MILPLIHIGLHKTGTSWLQRHWFPREELGWSLLDHGTLPFHEPAPFDFDVERYQDHYLPRIERAREAGLVPVLSAERLSGNPHSGGYDAKEIAERLALVFGEARILMVVREQREMILSCYGQYVRVGGGCSLVDYAFAPPDGRRPMFRLENFRYDRLVDFYHRLFGHEHVMVRAYEEFRDDPSTFVSELSRFARARGTDHGAFGQIENGSARPVAIALRRRVSPFLKRDSVNGYSPLRSRFLGRLLRPTIRVLDGVAPAAWQERTRRRWRRQIEERVGDYYAPSNRRLVELTGVDLPAHGYVCASERTVGPSS